MSHPTTTTTPAIVPGAGDSSSKATPTATSTDKQPERNSWFRGCVILADRLGGHKVVGTENPDVETTLDYVVSSNGPSWSSLRIRFPLGKDIEERGHGQFYTYDKHYRETRPATHHEIVIRFPDDLEWVVQDVPQEQLARFPEHLHKKLAVFRVRYRQEPIIYGFGKEFANPDHPCHKWLKHSGEMVSGMTVEKFVSQKEFMLVVGGQPGRDAFDKLMRGSPTVPWIYPYGNVHDWDVHRYSENRDVMEGSKFQLRTVFEDDNEHVAVVTQQVVQDTLWVALDAAEIFSTKFPAYFVPCSPNNAKEYFAIIRLPSEFSEQYQGWSQFMAKDSTISLAFHLDNAKMDAPNVEDARQWSELAPQGVWLGKVVENPAGVTVLRDHPVNDGELVLHVRRDSSVDALSTFLSREDADAAFLYSPDDSHNWVSLLFDTGIEEARRKVEAVCQFLPGALPTNPVVCAARFDPKRDDLPFYMQLHRELWCGAGFYKSLTRENDMVAGAASIPPRTIPCVDFIRGIDDGRLTALMESIDENERYRFRRYMAARPLGLALVTAPPGFGKTTVMSVGTLLLQSSVGKVYISAPTHVAVNNFASRLDEIDRRTTSRLNADLPPPKRERRKFIVRGYRIDDEMAAFRALLANPDLDSEQACPSRLWRGNARWRLHLSMTYWLLRVLGSPTVPKLDSDDSATLHMLRGRIDVDKGLSALRDCAQQKVSWQTLNQKGEGSLLSDETLGHVFAKLLSWADVVCTPPSSSEKFPYRNWKITQARAVAVDEAGNVSRADLCCVWGNTLLPCLLGGDDNQLRPAVMMVLQGPSEGVFYQRHVEDGLLSPLALFKISGVPVHRPKKQFRMGKGLFDAVAEIVYQDLDFEYGPDCDISLPVHQTGRDVEAYFSLRTYVRVDPVSRSKSSASQCKISLHLVQRLVVSAGVDPSRVAIISPYKANVQIIERLRKRTPDYSVLETMRPCVTVDSFQGAEADIMVVVMGTNTYVGPGFTKELNRLCVMFSRQRSGLIVVGDITVAGRYLEPGVKAKTKEEKSVENRERQGHMVSFPSGVVQVVKSVVLRKFYQRFVDEGRIVVMDYANEIVAQKEEFEQALARFKQEKRDKEEADA